MLKFVSDPSPLKRGGCGVSCYVSGIKQRREPKYVSVDEGALVVYADASPAYAP